MDSSDNSKADGNKDAKQVVGPESDAEFFHISHQSEATGQGHAPQTFTEILSQDDFDFAAPTAPLSGMASSLDEIQQPKFYESEDSSSNKKSNSTSQILEPDLPDDLDLYLPHDSLNTTYSQDQANIVSPKTDPFDDLNSSPSKTEGISAVKSPFDLGPDDDSLEEILPLQFTTPALPTHVEISHAREEELQHPSFKASEIHEEFGTGIPKSKPMEFKEPYEEVKNPSPLPGYQLEEDLSDESMLRQFDQKHSELETFLQGSAQDYPPSSTAGYHQEELSQFDKHDFAPSPIDDFDRSDNSVSPNPTQSNFGKTSEYKPYQKVEEPLFKHQEEKHNFSTPAGKPYFEQPDRGDFYGKDDEFEVVPPIPSHKQVPDYSSDFLGSFDSTSKPQREPPNLPEKPELISFGKQDKIEEVAKAVTRQIEDDLADFYPTGTFETVPSSYSEAPAVPSRSSELIKQKVPLKDDKSGSQKGKNKVSSTFEVSEEVQQILNIVYPVNWFDPSKLHPKVSELVYWRDPKKSGVVFGSIFIILIALTFLSFISVVAYTSLAVLTGTFAFRVYKNVLQAIQKTNDGHPFKEYLETDLSLQNDKSEEVFKAVIHYLNAAVIRLRHLFLVEDVVDSAKFGAALYMLTYLGSWFNGLTLIIIGFLALFGLPKVYETNKTIIDQYVDLAWAKISEVNSKVTAAIPWGKKEKAQ